MKLYDGVPFPRLWKSIWNTHARKAKSLVIDLSDCGKYGPVVQQTFWRRQARKARSFHLNEVPEWDIATGRL